MPVGPLERQISQSILISALLTWPLLEPPRGGYWWRLSEACVVLVVWPPHRQYQEGNWVSPKVHPKKISSLTASSLLKKVFISTDICSRIWKNDYFFCSTSTEGSSLELFSIINKIAPLSSISLCIFWLNKEKTKKLKSFGTFVQ